jgi:hypothetical protein
VTLCAVCTIHKETRARVSWFGLKTMVDGFSRFSIKIGGFGFSGFGLKTDSYGLVLRASKSQQWFLGMGLKTKWTTVYRLRHKINERMKMVRDTRRDLAVCFTWKQVRLGFSDLLSKLVEVGVEGTREIIAEVAWSSS